MPIMFLEMILLFLHLAMSVSILPLVGSTYTMLFFVDSIFFTHYGHFDGHFERQYMHTATITKMQTVYGNFSIFFFKK
jgi:hypothetical protein